MSSRSACGLCGKPFQNKPKSVGGDLELLFLLPKILLCGIHVQTDCCRICFWVFFANPVFTDL